MGYAPEISHGMLVEMDEHRKELEKKTKPILETLRSYQDLPPVSFYFSNKEQLACVGFLLFLDFEILFLFFIYLLFFIQDKALAALAIEDKKRQYAAAEKYLEDVLHSALSTSE